MGESVVTHASMKLDYPATHRNRAPLLRVLEATLPATGLVVEIGSGSGQHTAYFAAALPQLTWQPTDVSAEGRASADAWAADVPQATILPAVHLDVRQPWPMERADAVICANMIHIAPWSCTDGLLEGASAVLPTGGPLVLYGPFQEGARTAASNLSFDASLRQRDPRWGVRSLDAVLAAADSCRLDLSHRHDLPSNNLALVFRRR